MMGLDWPAIVFVLGAVFVSGLLRGLTGFGFAIAAVPLMSLALEPRASVALVVLLQLVIGLIDAPRAWTEARRAPLRWLFLGAVIGTPVGMVALRYLPADPARLIGAGAAALALISVWRGPTRPGSGGGGQPWAVGLAAGLLNGVAAMPGPPVVAYLLNAPGVDEKAARATLIVFFAGTAILAAASALSLGLLDTNTALLALLAAPPLLAGAGMGAWLFRNGPAGLYRRAALAVLALAALAAGARGAAGLIHGPGLAAVL